jgi:hypothetical protein
MSYATLRPRPASFAVLVLALAALTGCGDTTGPRDFVAEETFSYTLDATGKVRLDVEAVNGTITVTGVPGSNELTVDGVKQVWSSSQADADEYLDSLNLYADENADSFLVNTEQPSSSAGRTYVVNYEIELPDHLEVVIMSANGTITVASITNDVAVINANGTITLDDIQGSVSVALGNGDIEAEVTLPLAGTLELAIGNGDINLSIPQGTSAVFSAEVGNGGISVTNLAFQNEVTTNTSVRGMLGGGQGTINLSVGNGTIAATGF